MKKTAFLTSKNVFVAAALLSGLTGSSAWAACTAGVGGSMWNGDAVCVNTVNNTETGLATTNTNLATTNTNLATTNTNLATTNTNLATTNTNLATTNTNVANLNTAITTGDATTLSSAKAYTDAKALSASADTLNAANSYTNSKTAEALKNANAYTDKKSAEALSAANANTTEQVQKISSKLAGGVSAAVAMANIPSLNTDGKSMSIGVAVGTYDGQTALAVGGQKRFGGNGMARFSLAGSSGSGAKPALGAGAAWEF
jgi:trimeric autotransporter adhesin